MILLQLAWRAAWLCFVQDFCETPGSSACGWVYQPLCLGRLHYPLVPSKGVKTSFLDFWSLSGGVVLPGLDSSFSNTALSPPSIAGYERFCWAPASLPVTQRSCDQTLVNVALAYIHSGFGLRKQILQICSPHPWATKSAGNRKSAENHSPGL